ncbi:hypothetical protein AGMMS50262_23270 [Bacteroidia bacterium]|nr:hypothetical protein AGMMS50262_23270 [Bacteroidia bacterium]
MDKLVNIVIPIYKEQPDKYELISLNQGIEILNSYDFSIVCPQSLDTNYYENLLIENKINFTIQRFDDSYFVNLDSYSSLLLNISFYKRFVDYDYILIYQLDAYVFKDELSYWCSLGYDYIGAPWPKDIFVMEKGNIVFDKVGNGGFSLRKVQSFIDRLNYPYPLKTLNELKKEFACFNKLQMILRLPVLGLKVLGYKNTIGYFIKKGNLLEDVFWCIFLEETRIPLKIPTVKLASQFCMEIGAKQLYEENEKTLPFGCHAWLKRNYDFWRKFITN